ncbi:MAG: hypothetical protein MZU79_06875 [Anaerotruncus sp.]|nr:hypothetical protein [Anaerotruncus sp.]
MQSGIFCAKVKISALIPLRLIFSFQRSQRDRQWVYHAIFIDDDGRLQPLSSDRDVPAIDQDDLALSGPLIRSLHVHPSSRKIGRHLAVKSSRAAVFLAPSFLGPSDGPSGD